MLIKYIERLHLVLFILMVVCLSSLNAQDQKGAETTTSSKLDTYIRYEPSRDVKTVPGKVEIIKSGYIYDYEFKAFGKLPVKLSLENKYIGIENTLTNVDLPSHLVGLATGIETTLPFFKVNKTYLRLGVNPSFYADDWDFPASSFRIPSYYLLVSLPNDKLTLLYGIAVYPDFEDEVLPVLGFIYKPNDKLVFNIAPRRPNITYSLNDKISLFAEGNLAINNEFEVKRDSSKNVVLSFKETYFGGGVKYNLNQNIQASISGGGNFRRRLKYRDNQGKVDIKDGFYTEFRIEIKS